MKTVADDARAGPNRAAAERWAQAMTLGDLAIFDEVVAEEVVEEYPQSGEQFRGRHNLRELLVSFPGMDASIHPDVDRVVGGNDEWVMTPGYTIVSVGGGGKDFTITGKVRYPNGETWHLIQLIGVEDGKVARITSYFAEPFEAPDWRAPFREPGP